MNYMKFSIVLIARNESKTLPHLLKSLTEFKKKGGEVLLLDTGSTDNTVSVAKGLGCTVHAVGDKFLTVIDKALCEKINSHFVVEGESPVVKEGDTLFDFASARNFIASFSKTDWVWMPDCDEMFSKFDLGAIENAINDKTISRLEYEFVFSHDAAGDPAIRFMHSKMYRKSILQWKGIIHEILTPVEGSIPKGATYLPEDKVLLEHFQNVETNRNGYLKGLALDCYMHPESDRNSHYLGREMLWANRPKSAIRELERHIAMDKWPAERSQSMIYIGDAYLKLTDKN